MVSHRSPVVSFKVVSCKSPVFITNIICWDKTLGELLHATFYRTVYRDKSQVNYLGNLIPFLLSALGKDRDNNLPG